MSESESRGNLAQEQEAAQRRAWAKLTPRQRLEWLQQAKELNQRWLGAAAKRPGRGK